MVFGKNDGRGDRRFPLMRKRGDIQNLADLASEGTGGKGFFHNRGLPELGAGSLWSSDGPSSAAFGRVFNIFIAGSPPGDPLSGVIELWVHPGGACACLRS